MVLFVIIGFYLVNSVNILILDFERKVIENNTTEVTKGIIYFQKSKNTIIDVTYPLHQIMIIQNNELIFYYPEQKKAVKIISKNPIPPIFIFGILLSMQEDYGLSKLGYKLIGNSVKNDTLFTYWSPPKNIEKVAGKQVLGTIKDRIVYVETRNPKEEIVSKVLYSNFKVVGESQIALSVYSEVYNESKVIKEYISYSNVKWNEKLPNWVEIFKIPESIEMKIIK